MFSFFRRDRDPSPDIISHEDLAQLCKDGACVIIDVREPAEFANGRVPGARNMPLSQFNPETLPRDQDVILICQAGGRSARALAACKSAGLTQVRHYKPGTGGWIAKGGQVER
ncbi:MAG: rhodanese-like domain-containing protein [Beijerinckiaceae bacterium]|nr:rhodanese-like domain-containing protein [Beijerinckiaceae bacterium]